MSKEMPATLDKNRHLLIQIFLNFWLTQFFGITPRWLNRFNTYLATPNDGDSTDLPDGLYGVDAIEYIVGSFLIGIAAVATCAMIATISMLMLPSLTWIFGAVMAVTVVPMLLSVALFMILRDEIKRNYPASRFVANRIIKPIIRFALQPVLALIALLAIFVALIATAAVLSPSIAVPILLSFSVVTLCIAGLIAHAGFNQLGGWLKQFYNDPKYRKARLGLLAATPLAVFCISFLAFIILASLNLPVAATIVSIVASISFAATLLVTPCAFTALDEDKDFMQVVKDAIRKAPNPDSAAKSSLLYAKFPSTDKTSETSDPIVQTTTLWKPQADEGQVDNPENSETLTNT